MLRMTRRELREAILFILEEEIRKVKKGCWKVYPKKKGKKRRKALSKKCKSKKAALKQLKAVEISKAKRGK